MEPGLTGDCSLSSVYNHGTMAIKVIIAPQEFKGALSALAAAEAIAAHTGRESEVIDLRTLRPMDTKTVLDSVRKTNRAVVVEERWKTGGFAAEIASIVQEIAFDYLDGPVVRVGGLDVPTPYAGQLEAAVVPNVDRVVEAIQENFALR